MMALSGRNMSINLHERVDEVVSRSVACKAAVYTRTHTHMLKYNIMVTGRCHVTD
jgi:hypothetical protein